MTNPFNDNAVDLVPVTERARWWWFGFWTGALCGLWAGWLVSWIGRALTIVWSWL